MRQQAIQRSGLILMLLGTLTLFSGCVTQPLTQTRQSTIGPYSDFTARLIVIEPKRRWQVMLKWHASRPDQGHVRLNHAATGSVVEMRWANQKIQIRSNQSQQWRFIDPDELSMHGIVMPPAELARILLGDMPEHFISTKRDEWESRKDGGLIRLKWDPEAEKLTMTDIKHGRVATLMIQP